MRRLKLRDILKSQVSGSEGALKVLKTPKPLLFSPCHTNRQQVGHPAALKAI